MAKLEFKGIVKTGNKTRQAEAEEITTDYPNCAVTIGGEDVVDEVCELKWSKDVLVLLNGEQVARGDLFSETGWGIQ